MRRAQDPKGILPGRGDQAFLLIRPRSSCAAPCWLYPLGFGSCRGIGLAGIYTGGGKELHLLIRTISPPPPPPQSVVECGGMMALLCYLEFFSTSIQRIAVQAVANCCR